ncbi:hypothetical protein N0V94_006965 [Neodidymelliopsis sp. IMI 364377]|nr:hypothetical protein N0V94_006965 [Neodidymelliopsis sp. IMI 364377]
MEKVQVAAASATEKDLDSANMEVVDWNGPEDPENPQNCGPLLLVPLDEVFGRVSIYHAGNFLFIVFTIACALSTNMNMLVSFRFLAGLVSSAPMTVGGGTVVDILPPQKRGLGIIVWNLLLVAGPAVGPVAGGFLVQAAGWRWLFWLVAISGGVTALIAAIFLRESNPSILLKGKTKRLQKETGNPNLRSKLDPGLTTSQLLVRAVVRPTKLLFLSPIWGLFSLYNAFVYAIIYLFFTTFTFLFTEVYHFSEGMVGLSYIGSGIGIIAGMLFYGFTSDNLIQHLYQEEWPGSTQAGVSTASDYLRIAVHSSWSLPMKF